MVDMPTVFRVRRYVRQHIIARPDILVLFGDNLIGTGFGGQAAECRGLFNCLGIPVKRGPYKEASVFFTDEDYFQVIELIAQQFYLAMQVLNRRVIVYPALGIGTGRAALQETSPAIYKFLKQREQTLFNEAYEVAVVNNIGDIPNGI